MNKGARVEEYCQDITEVLVKKPVPLPLYSPQTKRGLAWNRISFIRHPEINTADLLPLKDIKNNTK
jgi:hypothetical protein